MQGGFSLFHPVRPASDTGKDDGENGEFLSRCPGGWEKHPENPLLGGEIGTCFDLSMRKEDGRMLMYFSWRDCHSIALCTSEDGIHWSKPEICIAPRQTPEHWEDALNRPCVVKVGSISHMWYTGQRMPGHEAGTSDIFHAVSEDGVHFTRTGDRPVLRAEMPWEKNSVMCPSVEWDEKAGIFRMWYSGEQYEPDAIGYAESRDGRCWSKSPLNPVFSADVAIPWEHAKVAGCHVFFEDGWYRMFYIGYQNIDYAQIGMARSRDGITNWERSSLNPIIAPGENAWDDEACYKPFVMHVGENWMLWYNGRHGHKEQIGLAIQPGNTLRF